MTLLASQPISAAEQIDRPLSPLAWSPDGSRLAYTQDDSLWVVKEPTYQPERLARVPGTVLMQVAWSPDGQHLAFYGGQVTLSNNSIWVVQADGSNLIDVFAGDTILDKALLKTINRWLDNSLLSFNIWGGTGVQHLWQVDVVNNKVTPMVDSYLNTERSQDLAQGGAYYWSPDGKRLIIDHYFLGHLVFTNVPPANEIWLSRPGGPPGQFFLDWSPDGQSFLYSQSEEGGEGYSGAYDPSLNLWLWEIARQSGRKLLPHVYQASLSPDGQRVAFLQQVDEQALFPPNFKNPPRYPENWPPRLTLGMLDLKTDETIFYGSAGYKANEGPFWWTGGRPVWSPAGQLIAYWRETGQVWLVSVDGKWQQCLAKTPEVIQIVWSPDGKKLALQLFERVLVLETPPKPS